MYHSPASRRYSSRVALPRSRRLSAGKQPSTSLECWPFGCFAAQQFTCLSGVLMQALHPPRPVQTIQICTSSYSASNYFSEVNLSVILFNKESLHHKVYSMNFIGTSYRLKLILVCCIYNKQRWLVSHQIDTFELIVKQHVRRTGNESSDLSEFLLLRTMIRAPNEHSLSGRTDQVD